MLPAFQGSWPALAHRWAGIAGLQRPLRHGQALPVRREAMAPMCPQGQHPGTNRFAQGPQARCPLQPATVATSPTGRHTQADRPERSSALGTAIPSMGGAMAQRPHIGRDGGKLGLRELGASQWRHRGSVFLRFRHPIGDRPGNGCEAAIAPQPPAAGEIRPLGSALASVPWQPSQGALAT